MRRSLPVLLSALLLAGALSGCRAGPPGPSPSSPPTAEAAELQPPLTQEDLELPVPDFLPPELQQLYRRAHNVYEHLFIETTGCEYAETFEPGTFPETPPETFEADGLRYRYARGRYKSWADFDALVHSVFTHRLFQALNGIEGHSSGLYAERDGALCFVDLIRPTAHTRNPNFPDTFVLLEQTEDLIRFHAVGYYSCLYPLEGEDMGTRDARLRAGYEYTEEFELILVRTEEGWRFDAFSDTSADAGEYPGGP